MPLDFIIIGVTAIAIIIITGKTKAANLIMNYNFKTYFNVMHSIAINSNWFFHLEVFSFILSLSWVVTPLNSPPSSLNCLDWEFYICTNSNHHAYCLYSYPAYLSSNETSPHSNY